MIVHTMTPEEIILEANKDIVDLDEKIFNAFFKRQLAFFKTCHMYKYPMCFLDNNIFKSKTGNTYTIVYGSECREHLGFNIFLHFINFNGQKEFIKMCPDRRSVILYTNHFLKRFKERSGIKNLNSNNLLNYLYKESIIVDNVVMSCKNRSLCLQRNGLVVTDMTNRNFNVKITYLGYDYLNKTNQELNEYLSKPCDDVETWKTILSNKL